jgi:NAD(P)H-dependent flavin oxidoreductase YrpB (nitropropane dioxygenase family)
MNLNNQVTELLKIKYPIIQAGWFGFRDGGSHQQFQIAGV